MSINKDWTREDNFGVFGRSRDKIFDEIVSGSLMVACVDANHSRMQKTVGLATKKYLDHNPEVKSRIVEFSAEKLNTLRITPEFLPTK